MDTWRRLIDRAERHTQPGQVWAWLYGFVTEPLDRLPYLFIHGPQMSGKTFFTEALRILSFPVSLDKIIMGHGFNGELIGKNLGIITESLREEQKKRVRHLYGQESFVIHQALKYPRLITNQLRFVQEANDIIDFPGIDPHLIIKMDKIGKDEFTTARHLLARLEHETVELRAHFGV